MPKESVWPSADFSYQHHATRSGGISNGEGMQQEEEGGVGDQCLIGGTDRNMTSREDYCEDLIAKDSPGIKPPHPTINLSPLFTKPP